ncbi:MAG: hypothetical protein J5736_01245 [Bacilli bacterium]|nr:hypothetical protein [Bacilli bacterium]
MKKYFDKDNFILSSFDKKQKIQSVVISAALGLFYVFSAFTFFNALYVFAELVGSMVSGSPDAALRDLLRSLPIFLSCFMSIWALLLAHGLFRNVNDEKRAKSIKKNGIALLSFAGVNVVAIIVMLIAGRFHSLVEGSPSPLYPLDSILYSLLYVALGVFALLYPSKFQEKLSYVVPSRGPIVGKVRGLYCTFVSIWMLVSLFSFAGFFLGLFIQDFAHGYVFFSIALLIVYLVNILFLAFWEFYFNELKEEKRKEFLLPIAIVGLAVSVLMMVLYFVGLGLNMDGPSNAGFGILPVAFTASVNIATLVVVATPFLVSVTALIKGLLARKK